MLLLLLFTPLCFTGASDVTERSECIGSSFKFPDEFHTTMFGGQLFFTPHSGGDRKLLMDMGEARDPRLVLNLSTMRLTQLTEDDSGTFSFSTVGNQTYNNVTLTVKDCTKMVDSLYGYTFSYALHPETQYITFTRPLGNDETQVVWNRTDPEVASRLQVYFIVIRIIKILMVTQSDNGYYDFWGSDNRLLLRLQLVVKEHTLDAWRDEHDSIVMYVPVKSVKWTVTFTPKGETETWTVIRNNFKTSQNHFGQRISFGYEGLEIQLKHEDAGVYTFKDPEGNVGMVVNLEVKRDDYEYKSAQQAKYVIPALGIIALVVIIVICVRKGCCKKMYEKLNPSAPHATAAEPIAHYHDTDEPAAPTSAPSITPAASTKPATPEGSRKPATPTVGTEVIDVGGQEAAPEPDSKQMFELKGENLLPEQPLNSDSTFTNFHESEKLNFL